ncbi:MAG: hypothetical protein AAF351_08600 [Pseudomonadota bacterium]
MLFRRVLKHFRNQEWGAVAIDFVIVVVGVYIGIQAQAWNTDRENREIEANYLESVRGEIERMIERDEPRVETLNQELVNLQEAMEVLEGVDTSTALELRHCATLAATHIYVGRVYVPPTIEELLSTGRLQLIRNRELRSEMVAFAQAVEGYRQLIADIQGDRLVLSRDFPNLVQLSFTDDENVTCDFEGMKDSAAFRNVVSDNRSRFRAYVEAVVVAQQERRFELLGMLNDELGSEQAADDLQ